METVSSHPTPKDLLGTEAAAKYAHVCVNTLRRAAKADKIPVYHFGSNGRKNYYRITDLDALYHPMLSEEERLIACAKAFAAQAHKPSPELKEHIAALLRP